MYHHLFFLSLFCPSKIIDFVCFVQQKYKKKHIHFNHKHTHKHNTYSWCVDFNCWAHVFVFRIEMPLRIHPLKSETESIKHTQTLIGLQSNPSTNTSTWTVRNVTFVYQLTVTSSTVAVHHLFSAFTLSHSQIHEFTFFPPKQIQKKLSIYQSIQLLFVVCVLHREQQQQRSHDWNTHTRFSTQRAYELISSLINQFTSQHEKC